MAFAYSNCFLGPKVSLKCNTFGHPGKFCGKGFSSVLACAKKLDQELLRESKVNLITLFTKRN